MEAARSSETSVSYRETTRHNHPEDLDLNLHRRENPKFSSKRNIFFLNIVWRIGLIYFMVILKTEDRQEERPGRV
jgi:hypothetical protein